MVELDGCACIPSCEDAKKKIGGDTLTAKNAVEECHKQQAQNIVKQGDLEDELADLKSEDFKPLHTCFYVLEINLIHFLDLPSFR